MHIAIIERVERGMEASVSSRRDIFSMLLCIMVLLLKGDARYTIIICLPLFDLYDDIL